MVRAAREQDLPRILTIYNVARRYMRAHGNTAQWVNGYPSEELLRQDLAAGQLYVLEDGGGVYAVFAFILGEDCLLYISPSPRDRTRSRMPSSA